MSRSVDVLAVLAYLASHDWDGDSLPGNAAVDSAIASVAGLVEAADRLERKAVEQARLTSSVFNSDVQNLRDALARVRGAA